MEKKKKKINFWKNGGLGKINKENHGKIEYDYGEDISWFPEEDDEDEIIDPFLDPENSVIQGPNKKKYSKFKALKNFSFRTLCSRFTSDYVIKFKGFFIITK